MQEFSNWKLESSILWIPVRYFLTSFMCVFIVGLVLAGIVFAFLANESPWVGLVGALLTLLEAIIIGLVWARKRALLLTVVHGLEKYRIGSAVTHLIFGRLLGVPERHDVLEPISVRVVKEEIVPLSQAERELGGAVEKLRETPRVPTTVGELVRYWTQSLVLAVIEKYAVARFREAGMKDGRVNLVKLRDEMENQVDGFLIGSLKRRLWLSMVLVMVAFPAQVLIMLACALAFLAWR